MRFRFNHPSSSKVGYAGVDFHLPGGFFAEVEEMGHVRSFDGLTTGCGYNPTEAPLEQVLAFLSREGFYAESELHEALVLLQEGGRVPKRLLLVTRIISELKLAANG